VQDASPAASAGTPVNAPSPLSRAACRDLILADTAAAVRIRAELRVDAIPATDAAAQAAAADPAADLATMGIPLTAAELAALHASGMYVDAATPIDFWAQTGETGRFGGLWIDPPGSGQIVVGILASDPSAMALAQCVHPGAGIRFVAAPTSEADLTALDGRIAADMMALRAKGIELASVGLAVRNMQMVVLVGVTGLTDAIRHDLTARYGDSIVIEEEGPITPAASGA
jgi:hypothetical protein